MPVEQGRFSIVLPVYNSESYVGQAIDSILDQSYDNFELLICDDRSTDKSLEVIRSFQDERIKIFTNEKNIGYLKTCNILFEKCQGDYITFQDADDYSSKERLEITLNHFDAHPNIYLFGTHSRCFDGANGQTIRMRNFLTPYERLGDVVRKYNPFDGATISIRREVYKSVGGYNTFYDRIGAEDYDWLSRIVEKFEASVIPEILYHVRLTHDSVSRSIKSPMQLISHDVVHFCQQQRAQAGVDGISGGDKAELDRFLEKKLGPYHEDDSLVLRKSAELYMYNKLYRKAAVSALLAIQKSPFRFINYRLLLYVLRKSNVKLTR